MEMVGEGGDGEGRRDGCHGLKLRKEVYDG